MRQSFIKMEYYETYYYANIISNILEDPSPYVRKIHEWYEENEEEVLLPPFPKWNRLQQFCEHVIESLIDENISLTAVDNIRNNPKAQLWLDRALKFHGFDISGFQEWMIENDREISDLTEDDLADYHNEQYLCGQLGDLIEHLSKETFHVLFANRNLLLSLNQFLSGILLFNFGDEVPEGLGNSFERPGKLKRVSIPEWVKRSVFYRDKGMCSSCNKDLSGLVTAQPDKHFDHMVPLALGGLNDITNIQLLCEKCNLSKSSMPNAVSKLYEAWY